MNIFYTGTIENRLDPLQLGRCQVRIVGLHSDDKILLPTSDLPWATPMQSITSAAMNGIGSTPLGVVLGTWVIIVFTDLDQQNPIILGTIGGIPQSNAASLVNESNPDVIANNSGILTDASGEELLTNDGIPIIVGSVESTNSGDSTLINSVDVNNIPEINIFDIPIPIDPPSGSSKNPSLARNNISLILNECDRVGLTSKYAKCAVLAIVGGESAWLSVEENHIYHDAKTLATIFNSTFGGNIEEATPYINWGGTKEDFFRKIYNPSGNGKRVGNIEDDDGAKYYGRGFVQTTGRGGYAQMQAELFKLGAHVDLLNSPQLLTVEAISSTVCAIFFKVNVKHDQNDQGYFSAALRATGNNVGSSYDKKQEYYEYFLGQESLINSTNKSRVDGQKLYTDEEINTFSPERRSALGEDRDINAFIGFCDPTGKYPLRDLMNEPDTNRLARGITEETAIAFKDKTRTTQIPAANGAMPWEQPPAAFGGKYPLVKVFESESGHLEICDDTPGNETTSRYHRKGTFTDVDANGTQVNKIVGDGYFILDRNGSIYIAGKANITVGNDINIMCMGNADIEVNGVSTVNLNNDADIGVAGNLTLAVGGDMDVKVEGLYNITAAGFTQYSTEDIQIQTEKSITTKSTGDNTIQTDGAFSTKAASEITIESDGDMSLVTGGSMYSTAEGDQNIKSGGAMLIDMIPLRPDYPEQVMYDYAGSGVNSKILENIIPIDLIIPDRENPTIIQSNPLMTPERDFSAVAAFETPYDYDTPAGIIERQAIDAKTPPEVKNNPLYKGIVNESKSTGSAFNRITTVPIVISDIANIEDFPTNYKISKHFNLEHVAGYNLQKTKNLDGNKFRTPKVITSSEVVENLAYMAENILEPIYELYGPTGGLSLGGAMSNSGVWQINDALRSGNSHSEHHEGCAIDIRPVLLGSRSCYEMAIDIAPKLKFNQFLLEYRTPTFIRKGQNSPTGVWWRWIHISFRKGGNINEYGTMLNDGNGATGKYWNYSFIHVGDGIGMEKVSHTIPNRNVVITNPTTNPPIEPVVKINLNDPAQWYKEFCRLNGIPYNPRENQAAAKEYWLLLASRKPDIIKVP